MLSPSTAPRWNRQTSTGRSEAPAAGRVEANAARARNRGSRPRLNKASPPDFTNTRLVIGMRRSLAFVAPPPLRDGSLALRPPGPDRQPHRERARRGGLANVGQLFADHAL